MPMMRVLANNKLRPQQQAKVEGRRAAVTTYACGNGKETLALLDVQSGTQDLQWRVARGSQRSLGSP